MYLIIQIKSCVRNVNSCSVHSVFPASCLTSSVFMTCVRHGVLCCVVLCCVLWFCSTETVPSGPANLIDSCMMTLFNYSLKLLFNYQVIAYLVMDCQPQVLTGDLQLRQCIQSLCCVWRLHVSLHKHQFAGLGLVTWKYQWSLTVAETRNSFSWRIWTSGTNTG